MVAVNNSPTLDSAQNNALLDWIEAEAAADLAQAHADSLKSAAQVAIPDAQPFARVGDDHICMNFNGSLQRVKLLILGPRQ